VSEYEQTTLAGSSGNLVVYRWPTDRPHWIAILSHGYGEHLGRYGHVADRLIRAGAVVYGADHVGHGRSDGERVLIEDFEPVVGDVHRVVEQAQQAYPNLPVVLVGHSMGGMIAARFGQRYGRELAALVLSGPVLGSWGPTALADWSEIPDDQVDPATLSRDPAVGEAYAADPLVWHGGFKRPTLHALADELGIIDNGGDLGLLPTLWIHGEADQLVPIGPAREGLDKIRGSDLVEHTFPGARHEVLNETNSAEVLDVVTSFVTQHV
jgi:alpha-beta hydrolase superfamily lysophospholipase